MFYRDYIIEYNPKPIPDRSCDYDWFPEDYDGPEDGRGGTAGTVEEAERMVDEEIDERSQEDEDGPSRTQRFNRLTRTGRLY